ncbi:hypothetical protein CPB85DRAFT_1335323 [Mucidula mucida]|nr:hypothetical protein CPB85DRAFT_1335323 [Mucidula mucida]
MPMISSLSAGLGLVFMRSLPVFFGRPPNITMSWSRLKPDGKPVPFTTELVAALRETSQRLGGQNFFGPNRNKT